MVDPRDELTDVRMPEVGTDGHVALLITEYLAARADDGSGCPPSELHALVRRLANEHQAYWRRSTRDPGAEIGLVEHALERLAALRLIRRADDVDPPPAGARALRTGRADTPVGHRGTRVSCLPAPARERWQPLRLGLVDLFYYDHEVFDFRDGRLLLRGNNGTGKSKVLALTLPFLLDGDLSAHRVEPDADPNKRMEWNLLLGGEHPNDERLGYTWLEFGRRGDDGAAFCTIGCGMKAVKGRGIAAHWFFLTDQRVGEDLRLVDATGVALTADRLEDAIGVSGSVHRRARDYRRAVDERLFGLGDARYGALIDLLIKVRAPQLSKRPDERGLSAALTGALPPLDQALIADVAEAFRALEEDSEQLAAMVEARDASERYLTTYRAYARMATRRRAAPLRQAQTAFDRLSRELGEAEDRLAHAQAELAHAQETLEALRAERTRLDARRQALQDDPAARSARELRRAAEEAEQANRQRAEAQSAVERLELRVAELRNRLTEAEAEEAGARSDLVAIQSEAADCGNRARIAAPLAQAIAEADPRRCASASRH